MNCSVALHMQLWVTVSAGSRGKMNSKTNDKQFAVNEHIHVPKHAKLTAISHVTVRRGSYLLSDVVQMFQRGLIMALLSQSIKQI